MPTWTYDGVDNAGQRVKGKVVATTQAEVRKILRGQGVRPKAINPPSLLEFDLAEWMVARGIGASFGVKEINSFTKQLAVMLNAGVPIVQSLEILMRSEGNPGFKRTLSMIMTEVAEGQTLADAIRKQEGFTKLYANLIAAGETGGILDTILNKLAEHMEKQEKTKAQIKSAMMYPSLVTIVGLGVVYGMMVFVVPQFQDMVSDTGQELPAITAFVIGLSKWLQAYTLYLLPLAGLSIFALLKYIKTPVGKRHYDMLSMKMPLFGGIVVKGNLTSFTRTMATMLSSGIALIDALDICSETIDNGIIADDIRRVRKAVVEGKTLTEPLLKIDYFPEMVAQMVRVGEQTGNVDQMLLKVSNVFENEVDNLVSGMTKMIEPIILVGLGGIIAVILVAMYLPMFMSAGG